jgi:hypothetical protein
MGPMFQCAAVIATSLIIEGVELNPLSADNIAQDAVTTIELESRERNVTGVAGNFIRAVEMLNFK